MIERELGSGGFGRVFLGHDKKLQREVAIKVFELRPDADVSPDREAVALARLDHPGIVPIYDVGIVEQGPFEGRPYLVARYIPGPTLTELLRTRTFSPARSADLVAELCDAVQHAHSRGVILRDLKPSNIILEEGDRPVLIDLGIALFEENFGIDPLRTAGTLAYMSPEQAGAGLVDARSDVYSLGAILYELLAGRIPFGGNTQTTITQIRQEEPQRPSLRNQQVSPELELICSKSLAKLPANRYQTATELAGALRNPIMGVPAPPKPTRQTLSPKGLRAFDAEDANVFLNLLPGARSPVSGLPESIHFWTSRIGPPDTRDVTSERLMVGVLHGQSGSGKSSLLRAGVLPRLHPSVIPVFAEAASGPVEQRLVSQLRSVHQEIPPNADLPAAIKGIQAREDARPVLIAVDQFEQWLRDWDFSHTGELVRAMRLIDPDHLQFLFVVRDDFWSRMSKFMEAIGYELHQNHNTRAVELFERDHAEAILATFGQALGALPDEPDASQKAFISDAVKALTENTEKKAYPVQIALLAEVFKDREWTSEELAKVGGVRSIGRLFLDQSFLFTTAPARYRFHAEAATSVLNKLLPASNSSLRQTAVPLSEIRQASGYANDEKAFADLRQILDTELRLITPSDAEEGVRYQITHDYLVPSIREWIERQRSDTKRGRAQLRLENLSAAWTVDADRRHVPGIADYLRIVTRTNRREWTEGQRRLMKMAGRRTAGILACVCIAATMAGLLIGATRAKAQRQAWLADLRSTSTESLTPLLGSQFPGDRLDTIELRNLFERAPEGSTERFHLGLALLKLEPSDELAAQLFPALLRCGPQGFAAALPVFLERDPSLPERIARAEANPVNPPPASLLLVSLASAPGTDFAGIQSSLERFLDQAPADLRAWLGVIDRPRDLLPFLDEVEGLPTESTGEKERRHAYSTLVRILLGDESAITDYLSLPGVPVRQAYLIDALQPAGIPEDTILQLIGSAASSQVQAKLLQALQLYNPAGSAPSTGALRAAERAYATAEDIYPHNSAAMLLGSWQIDLPALSSFGEDERGRRNWIVNEWETKLAVIEPSADSGIRHTFALSTTPIIFRDYREFLEGTGVKGHEQDGFPAYEMTLYTAMAICNRLSSEEGLTPCYEPFPDDPKRLQPAPDYLNLDGYRVPTPDEMELASRGHHLGGNVPAEYPDLVDNYEWTSQNWGETRHPSGRLRPNGFGVFDPLSNFSEWLLEPVELPPHLDSKERDFEIGKKTYKIASSAATDPEHIRVGHFSNEKPLPGRLGTTFRLVRTLGAAPE